MHILNHINLRSGIPEDTSYIRQFCQASKYFVRYFVGVAADRNSVDKGDRKVLFKVMVMTTVMR